VCMYVCEVYFRVSVFVLRVDPKKASFVFTLCVRVCVYVWVIEHKR